MCCKTTAVAMLLLCIALSHSRSQSVPTFLGARLAGMGQTSSCSPDEWSVFNNMGGLASINQTTVAATCEHTSLPGGNRVALALAHPVKVGVAGIGVFRFGDDVYNEQIITAGFSNRLGIVSLGARINYVQYRAEGFRTRSALGVCFGGIAELTPSIKIGAHILNLNQPVISTEYGKEYLPTLLVAGLSLKASAKVWMVTEVEKDIEYKPTWKTGIEYNPFSKVSFRTGFNLQPNAYFFGTGFRSSRIKTDYAFKYAVMPGPAHQLSVAYLLTSK